MNIKFYLIPFLFVLFSCVSKDEFKQLQEENSSLKFEVDMLNTTIERQNSEVENYKTQIESLEERNLEIENELVRYKPKGNILSSKTFSEQEAENTVNDYYSFYERDYVIRNIQVRRKSNASFWVSYEKANRKFSNDDFFYKSETKILEFYENDNYQLKNNW